MVSVDSVYKVAHTSMAMFYRGICTYHGTGLRGKPCLPSCKATPTTQTMRPLLFSISQCSYLLDCSSGSFLSNRPRRGAVAWCNRLTDGLTVAPLYSVTVVSNESFAGLRSSYDTGNCTIPWHTRFTLGSHLV